MRLPSAPLRFVIAVVALWTGARVFVLMPGESVAVAEEVRAPVIRGAALRERRAPMPTALALVVRLGASFSPTPTPMPRPLPRADVQVADMQAPARVPLLLAADGGVRSTPRAELSPFPPPSVMPAALRRWSGSTWLYARAGSERALAGGGQLGGGQAGARLAYRVAAPVAVAARVSSPLADRRGAEGALGVDLLPLGDQPFRLSVERRFDLGGQGRNAWSAYAAGGFYRTVTPAVELDGYAQAGIVGARRRDLFADGALRVGRRFELGEGRVLRVGGGAWGAAQPGAARLDVGPRVAVSLPAGDATVTAALEGRVKVAGDARPGSGVAFTLSTDF